MTDFLGNQRGLSGCKRDNQRVAYATAVASVRPSNCELKLVQEMTHWCLQAHGVVTDGTQCNFRTAYHNAGRNSEPQDSSSTNCCTPSKCIADELSHNDAAWLPSGTPWSTMRVTNTIAAELPTSMCHGAPMPAGRTVSDGHDRPCSCSASSQTM